MSYHLLAPRGAPYYTSSEMPDQDSPSVAETEELRLFPLNLVLFPGMSLPLHIFEERYKLMIGECLDGDMPFGIVLIREGPEVGGPATPHKVGTAARIARVERLEKGQMNLQTKGERRFRIQKITQELPFLMARVEYLKDEGGEDLGDLTAEAAGLLAEYWKVLTGLKGGWTSQVEILEEPIALSYAIAQSLARPPRVGQYLLQVPTVKERLELEIPLLKERLDLARKELAKRNSYHGPRLN